MLVDAIAGNISPEATAQAGDIMLTQRGGARPSVMETSTMCWLATIRQRHQARKLDFYVSDALYGKLRGIRPRW
jgi:hypothetical protein